MDPVRGVSDPGDGLVLLDVPVVFDVRGGATVHSPMVDATVGGLATRLVLDTGSTAHVLTKELIDRAGVDAQTAEDGTDHAGAPVASWSVGALDVELAARTFALREVVAIAAPGPFEGWGIGGFLSPQHLHPTARVLIDLVADRLVVVDPRDGDPIEVDARLATRLPGHRRLTLPRAAGSTTVAVEAAIDGFAPVAAMLDTGGRGTEFARRAAPTLPTADVGRRGSGVSGAGVMGAGAGHRVVVVGGVRVPVTNLVIRDEMDDPPGIIGMDVLRGTALIFGADRTESVIWLVPEAWPVT